MDVRDCGLQIFYICSAIVRYTLLLYSYVDAQYRVSLHLFINRSHYGERIPERCHSKRIVCRIRDIVNLNCLHAHVAYHSAGCHPRALQK